MKQANGAKPGVLDLTLTGMWHNSHVMGPGSQTVKEQRVPIDHPMIMARDVFALQQICHNSRVTPSYTLNNLNEITISLMGVPYDFGWSISNGVSGSTTSPATNVLVNGVSAALYADNSFYATLLGITNGPNTYTAIAWDTNGNVSSNSSTVYAVLTNGLYAYDQNGNLTNDGYKSFAYDDENELIGVWVTNAWSNSFAYDGKMRRRIERDYAYLPSSNAYLLTNEVHFIYDGSVVVEERNANNVPLVSYTRGIGGLLARTTYGEELPGAPTTAYYHADGNGNITALIYPNQQLAAKYLYDPFGNMLAMSGPLASFNRYRFSSKEWNDNSGLYYFGRRFYAPNLQRWINRDPLQESGGLNLYQFAANNSINSVDPFGLWPCWLQNLWNSFFGPEPGYNPTEDPNSPYYIDPNLLNNTVFGSNTSQAPSIPYSFVGLDFNPEMESPDEPSTLSLLLLGLSALSLDPAFSASADNADQAAQLQQLLQARDTAGTALSVAQQSAEDADAAFTQLNQELSSAARKADSPDEISEDLSFATQDAKTQLQQANAALQAAQKNFDAAQDAVLNFGQ